MHNIPTSINNPVLSLPLARKTLVAAILLILSLSLYACAGDSPAQPTPASSPTTSTSVALATPLASDSAPSVSWADMYAAAEAKVRSVYTDAIPSSVNASPYDFTISPDYKPSTDIQSVSFNFMTPAVKIITVVMADDSPSTTLRMTESDYSADNSTNEIFREIYSDKLKNKEAIAKAFAEVKITPREAEQRTQKEATEHASQIGLGTEVLIPEIQLDSLNAAGPQWSVTFRLNPVGANGTLTPKKPVAIYSVSAQSGEITARTYQDAEDPFADLAATPGYTSSMEALATALMPTVIAQETQSPTTDAEKAYDNGKMSEITGSQDQALAYYSEAIKLDPQYADAYLARALIYQNKNDFNSTIADCTTAISIKPSYEAYITRGNAYAHMGDTDPTMRQPDLALSDFNAAKQIDPDKAEVYSYIALAYYYKGDYDSAISNNTEAIKRDANYADAYFARGESYQAKQEYDLAISDFDQYIKLRPNTSWAFRQRADVYQAKGDYPHAILDYTEAIRLQPDYRDAYYDRGYSYERSFDYTHALQDFNKVLDLDPKFQFAYEGRGEVYYATGRYADAISEFNTALTMPPEIARIYEERGRAYLRSGETDESLSDFSKAITLAPDQVLAYVSRGRAYVSKGEYDSALSDFNLAIKQQVNFTYAYSNRAIAYAYKGDFTSAFSDIDQAFQIGNDDEDAYFARGKVYELQGDKEKALADFNKCAQLTQNLNTKQDIEKELQNLQKK